MWEFRKWELQYRIPPWRVEIWDVARPPSDNDRRYSRKRERLFISNYQGLNLMEMTTSFTPWLRPLTTRNWALYHGFIGFIRQLFLVMISWWRLKAANNKKPLLMTMFKQQKLQFYSPWGILHQSTNENTLNNQNSHCHHFLSVYSLQLTGDYARSRCASRSRCTNLQRPSYGKSVFYRLLCYRSLTTHLVIHRRSQTGLLKLSSRLTGHPRSSPC